MTMAGNGDFRKMLFIFYCLVGLLSIHINVVNGSVKSGHCPMQGNVKNCVSRCKSDYECTGDNKCCLNICGTTTCASPVFAFSGNDPMRQQNNNLIMCGNVKCQTGQKCVSTGSMRKPKCSW